MNERMLFALAMFAASAAIAQDAVRLNPNNPSAVVPRLTYSSAFEGYRPFAEQDVQNWRKANEEVSAVGGNKDRVPGQGIEQSAPAESPAAPASKTLAPQDHGGHK